jgi:hypothetical protein
MGSSMPDASTKTWAAWLGATVTTFAALEAYAVSSRRVPTLTHCLRLWLGLSPAKGYRWIAVGLFTCFWLWLCGHLAFQWPPNLPGDSTTIAPSGSERSDHLEELTTYERSVWR